MLALILSLLLAAEPVAPPRAPVGFRDLDPFPTHWIVKANLDFAWRHVAWLEASATWQPRLAHEPGWLEWRAEARLRVLLWDDLDTATGDYTCEFRLEALDRLRDALGPEAYAGGRMPPPVPIEWFRRVP